MRYSQRIREMAESPIRKLAPHAESAKERGITVYHLNIGQPDIKTPKQMLQAIHSMPLDIIAYGPSEGLPSYRRRLPEYYASKGIHLTYEDILITTAGSEALLFLLMALCDHGDELIVPEPYYANMNGFSSMAGVTLVPVRTRIEDGFSLPDTPAFAAAVTERTRGILICNPNNPTGAVYQESQLHELAGLVKEKDLFLAADEVYREFVYDGKTHTSILSLPAIQDRTVVVDSISKRYSACGARIGTFISRDRGLLAGVLKMAQARLCPPTVEQMAAEAVLDLDQSYFDDVLKEYQLRRDILYQGLSSIPGVVCSKPAGAFYLVARLPVDEAEKFAVFMLRDFSHEGKTVMLAPASGFYQTPGAGRDEVRIAYVLNVRDLEQSIDIIRRGLEAYRSR